MVELNKEQAIVVAVTGLTSLAAGLVAGRFWGKSAARKAAAKAAVTTTTTTETDKPAGDSANAAA